MIMVGVPTALICMLVSGIIWGNLVGNKIFTELPANVEEIKDDGKSYHRSDFNYFWWSVSPRLDCRLAGATYSLTSCDFIVTIWIHDRAFGS